MLDSKPGRDTKYHEGLNCPLCGRSLLSVPLGDSIVFHCKNGHQLSLSDLLRAQNQSLGRGLLMLMGDWESQLETLEKTAEDARSNGYLEIAEIFLRQTRLLAGRIEALRGCLPKAEDDASRCFRLSELRENTGSV